MGLEGWEQIGRKTLLLNILLSQGLFLGLGCVAYYFVVLRPSGVWAGLFSQAIGWWDVAWLFLGTAALCALQGIFLKIAGSASYFYDDINALLIERFRLEELAAIFLFSAFTEELLFRGVLQVWLGLLPAACLFSLVHFRYLKKPLLLSEVLLLGILLGLLYQQTSSVWICTLAHGFVNWIMAWAIKTGRIAYVK